MAHLITPTQMSAIIDLTMEEPHEIKPSDHSNQVKWAALEEILRVVKGSDFYDLIRATKICLVSNVVVPKKFRVPKFVNYMGLKCPNTHLRSYYNKTVKVIHDEKLLIHFF